MDSAPDRPRAFSGIQPTGTIHLGNYLGALRNWAKMQDSTDGIYCIVDLHALSVPREPGEVRRATIEAAKALATEGEIVAALEGVFGTYVEPAVF